jgi:predicted AAA+ superfamily ATPase
VQPTYQRRLAEGVLRALHRDPPLIQVIAGPRQVGKTTAARAIAKEWALQDFFARDPAELLRAH